MTTIDFTLIGVFVVVFAALISPRVRRRQAWLATVTPLASIIGSGFLVSAPLMASALGVWAVAAVVGMTFLAWLTGAAIRYNILWAEPMLADAGPGDAVKSVETASHIVLIGAYFVSVSYYLVLLAAFGMKLFGLENPLIGKASASAIVLGICAVGASRGLKGVERAEIFTVSANLAAIAAMLAALVLFDAHLPAGYSVQAALSEKHPVDWETIRFLMGLVIIVQGFETSRFMGQLYDAPTRIAAMSRAQTSSTLVYLVFFVLMVPLYPYFTSTTDVGAFITVIGRVSTWLPYVVAGGAIASQFSASVADSIGCSGLISETTRRHVNANHAYLLIGAVSLMAIWGTNVVSIVALASRAFALFYALQCAVATLVARKRAERGRAAGFGALSAAMFVVALFGVPAGG